MSSGAGAGSAVRGWAVNSGVVDIDDHAASHPSSRSASPVVVTAAIGAASASMNPIRAAGMRRVDRQIGRPGLEHRQHRHDRLGRPGQQQRHTLTRAHTVSGQQVRQPVCRLLNFAVGPRVVPAADRDRLGAALPRVRRTTPESTPRRCGLGQHRPVTPPLQPGLLTGIEQIQRRQPPCRVGGDRHQHPLQPLDQRFDAGRVEHVGAKFHVPANPGGRTGLGADVRPG